MISDAAEAKLIQDEFALNWRRFVMMDLPRPMRVLMVVRQIAGKMNVRA